MTETFSGERLGITLPLPGLTLRDHETWLGKLVSAGFTDAWTAEGGGPMDAFTPLSLASVWAPSLRLGTAVVSSFTRGPAVLASTAAALSGLAPGRFAVGIGSSSDVIVERWNGLAFERPLSRTRDVLRFLKAAFAGERIDKDYETFSIRGFCLGPALDPAPPVLVAALRPKMLQLAGAEADGAILNWISAADVDVVAPIVRSTNPGAEIVCRIMVCPTEDPAEVYRKVKPIVAAYTVVGVYRAFHTWLGRGADLSAAWDAWDRGDRKAAVAHVPDHVVDALCIHGAPEDCRRQLQQYVDHGVTTPVLALVAPGDDHLAALEALLQR